MLIGFFMICYVKKYVIGLFVRMDINVKKYVFIYNCVGFVMLKS